MGGVTHPESIWSHISCNLLTPLNDCHQGADHQSGPGVGAIGTAGISPFRRWPCCVSTGRGCMMTSRCTRRVKLLQHCNTTIALTVRLILIESVLLQISRCTGFYPAQKGAGKGGEGAGEAP